MGRCCFNSSLLAAVALLVLSTHVLAQSTASIEGLVTDQQAALIAGAEIAADDLAIGVTRVVVTDVGGRYQIAALPDWLQVQLRAEFFNLFNHANFGRPGNVVDTPAVARITSTRFPTGESGSSRQIQLAMKLILN
jgi:carboxypeptidase family protein